MLDSAEEICLSSIAPFARWLYSQEYDFTLNNREKATGIIFFVFIVWACLHRDIRSSLANFVRSLFNRHFNRVYVEILLYTLSMVCLLYRLGFWEFRYTKDTLLWILFSALYLSFEAADSMNNDFSKMLKRSLSATALIEFLLNTYTFSVILEVAVLIILSLLSMSIVFLENHPEKEEYYQVQKLMTGFNAYAGLNILLFLAVEVISNLRSLLSLETLRTFMLPIVLSVMFIPYLFYLVVRLSYDQLTVYARVKKGKSRWVVLYFKARMYLHCRLDRSKITALKSKRHLINNMRTTKDVDNIFGERISG